MKYARFRDSAGFVRDGTWTDDGIESAGRVFDFERVDVLPPATPSKVIGVSRNYRKLIEDIGAEVPKTPRIYLKGGPNVVTGHQDTVPLLEDKKVNFEAELGVVIGEQCRRVPEASAMDVVAGFTCANDVTNEDAREDPYMYTMKSFDSSGPIGPLVATPEHVPENPRIRLWTNGEKRQDSADDELLFSVEEVVAEVSTYATLQSGDVITMGSFAGRGELHDGDTVEIQIEGVGTLTHDVAADY